MLASDRYELIEELGRGSMGVVYRAHDRRLGREVAVKMLLRDGEANPRLLARMMREAQAVATLEHPNIVRIHDVLEDALVMEYVRGRPLELGALPPAERLRALEDVARAIHAAHERGIVHRDLKPGNVLREESGRVVVMDFGLAHMTGARTRLTRSGVVVGTPLYMAPEQIRGERADGRADVYSLGVMLYEALAGHVPFTAATPAELYGKVLMKDPPPLKGVSKDLATICHRALEKDPRDRYRTARALAEDLESHRVGRAIATRPMSVWTRLARRKSVVLLVGAIGLLAVFATGTALKLRWTREDLADDRRALLEEMRRTSESCLEAALDLRRVGKVERMGEYSSKVYAICDRVSGEMPGLAEPHYVRGRMHRALMKEEEALGEQERALAKQPGYARALYERVVLMARRYRQRAEEIVEEERRREGCRLVREGGGQVRPGQPRAARSWLTVAKTDPRAREVLERMEKDLALLKTEAEALSEEQRACVEGFRAWAVDQCEHVRSIFGGVVGKEPHLEEAYEALATHEGSHEKYEKAIEWWTAGIEKDRGYLPFLWGRGLARRNWARYEARRGENAVALYEGAIEDFDRVLALDPGRREMWILRGTVWIDWGNYEASRGEDAGDLYARAIDDIGQELALNQGHDEAWLARGTARANWALCKERRGEDPVALYEGAIKDCGEALSRDPERSGTWLLRGLTRTGWGVYKASHGEDPVALYEEAIEDCGKALSLDPGQSETWTVRGLACMNLGEWRARRGEDPVAWYEKAIEDYRESHKLNPEYDEAWAWCAMTRMKWGTYKQGRGEDPVALYEQVIEESGVALRLNSAGVETWMARGQARTNWGLYKAEHGEDPVAAYEESIGDYSEAIKLGPERSEAWMGRGVARLNWGLYKAGRGEDPGVLYQEAIGDFEKAVAINRSRAEAWRFLGETHFSWSLHLASQGRPGDAHYRSAWEAFRQAVRLHPAMEPVVRPRMEECRRQIGAGSGE
ncbi:MAG: protein kinase [Planctomycetes bacterium]|nr:protein kinase [Planctomycetota bacterium]